MDKTITVITTKSNNLDGSVGNSICRWAQAYYLNSKCNFEYKIILNKEKWSELNLVEFPHTELRSIDMTLSYHVVDCDLMREVIIDNKIDNFIKHDHLIIEEWIIFDNCVIIDPRDSIRYKFLWDGPDPISLIKFKSKNIENFFKDEFSDFISIHIRRYHCVMITQKQIATLPEEIREDFSRDYRKHSTVYLEGWKQTAEQIVEIVNSGLRSHSTYLHPFIPDKQFYSVIDHVLDYNIDQKFYISTDIPKKYYQYYKEKYRNIYDKYDYLEKFESIVRDNYSENILNFDTKINGIENYYDKKEHFVFGNLLDLFALSNSKLIVQSYLSSWGRIAKRMNDVEQIILPISSETNSRSTKPHQFYSILRKTYNYKLKYSEIAKLKSLNIDTLDPNLGQ